jgi:hypothetical protein
VLAVLLGFLPGTALLPPALLKLWTERDGKIARFLLAWVIGYLVYLEALSGKPGTYMVQPLFAAFAIAVAMLVATADGKQPAPAYHAMPWPPFAALFAIALFAAPYAAVREYPAPWLVAPIAAVAALFYWSAAEGRAGRLKRWAGSGVAALGLFAVTLLGGVLPSIDKIWPASQVQRYIKASCDPNLSVGVVGFREPSATFLLDRDHTRATPQSVVAGAPDITIVESRWLDRYSEAIKASGASSFGAHYGCIESVNMMRGCPLTFWVFGKPDGQDLCFATVAASCSGKNVIRRPSDACD